MSHSQPFSYSYHSNHEKADDSSTVFDAYTVVPDEVPSLPPASQEESPQSFTSVLLRRINSRHRPAEPSTTTATATRSVGISRSNQHQSSSSSSSKKRSSTNSSSHLSSRKKTRQSSRLKRQPDQNCTDEKSDSEVEDENGREDYEPNEAVINQSSSSSSQTSTTKGLTKHELKWRSKFEDLRAYKRSNGNVNVPQSNKQLSRWVSKQRTQYRKLKDNKHSYMTNERIEMLESIDFEWVAPETRFEKDESAWNKRFTELKDYKEKYGRTNVPYKWEDNKELGLWVNKQRAEYKKFKKNGKGKITHERIQILESIDFEWVSPNQGGPRNESEWNKRFTELKEYKEKYGRTNVPYRWEDNKQLGRWVHTQRTQYKRFKKNGKSCITPERIQMLESIGFEW